MTEKLNIEFNLVFVENKNYNILNNFSIVNLFVLGHDKQIPRSNIIENYSIEDEWNDYEYGERVLISLEEDKIIFNYKSTPVTKIKLYHTDIYRPQLKSAKKL